MAASAANARVAAIEAEGAAVIRVAGTYDDAMRAMARDARVHGWRVISDTALDDDDFRCATADHARLHAHHGRGSRCSGPTSRPTSSSYQAASEAWSPPSPIGAARPAAAPRWCASSRRAAACLQVSARAGRPDDGARTVRRRSWRGCAAARCRARGSMRCSGAWPGTSPSKTGGPPTRCGTWQRAWAAIRRLEVGASGAAALGGLLATLRDPATAELKAALDLGPASRIVVLATEGVTDPDLFASIVGESQKRTPGAEKSGTLAG